MKSYNNTARIVGILFIIATLFLFIGDAIYNPIIDSPDYLSLTYPHRLTVVTGILIEFICTIAIPLIPVFLYAPLKKHYESLALGYLGFRFFEAIFFVHTQINELSLINISQGYLTSSPETAHFFQFLGDSIKARNLWNFSIYVLIFAIGALILNYILLKSKLVPRFISIWGILASILIFVGSTLSMFEVQIGPSNASFELIFATPIAIQEMVFALWLIIKGFNPPKLQSRQHL